MGNYIWNNYLARKRPRAEKEKFETKGKSERENNTKIIKKGQIKEIFATLSSTIPKYITI
jgi:hypothetical protein